MGLFILIICVLFSKENSYGSEMDFGAGLSFPMIKGKFYVAPYFDISSKLIGGYFDIGLAYTTEDNESINNENWLGYYLNTELYLRPLPLKPINFKAGLGYSFHHLAHIDGSLKYHIFPLNITAEYHLPTTSLVLFYKFQYPIAHTDDMEFETSFINFIGVGFSF